ncbi:uncharacterized protein LOC124643945 [Helicoverpa zea]|uniref:uncharacterized protein LOC124643945 n=1 Tax=Helicoverpa zea TaxID=7113 RepID=UPI001F55D591|nr:uncharacterized protein LOC124643945 [Helicoverpa zea]
MEISDVGSSRANGQVERVMRTLKSLLTIVENEQNKTWRDQPGNIQLALNSTKSTVTKYSPTELMFGIRDNHWQTKLDKKFKGPFIITSVLENDRYELKNINGSNRVYKCS